MFNESIVDVYSITPSLGNSFEYTFGEDQCDLELQLTSAEQKILSMGIWEDAKPETALFKEISQIKLDSSKYTEEIPTEGSNSERKNSEISQSVPNCQDHYEELLMLKRYSSYKWNSVASRTKRAKSA